MTIFEAATAAMIQYGLDCGLLVAEGDTEGRVIPLSYPHPVRVLTAAADVIIGMRDLLRGDKRYALPRFGPCVVGEWYFS